MITIVDYGAGNLKSVANMVQRVGGQSEIVVDPSALSTARLILLPGVGAFDHAMRELAAHGWVDALNEAALERRIPVVGICLGMQLLCKGSEEGKLPGLGWIDGYARRFRVAPDSGLKVPHMGWNTVTAAKENPLVAPTDEEQRFYFVHSYHVECADPGD
ncbi:MAG: imidazole glycerol phosphate synthase subunit HisH, partial [Xanthomonadaceae bacterium]|nr:imidazole glycerol phosphate synthase subunit HisH [Xanthomonadaceae bacterium]